MPRLDSGRNMGHVSRPTHIMHSRPENLQAPAPSHIQAAICGYVSVQIFRRRPNGQLAVDYGRSYGQVS